MYHRQNNGRKEENKERLLEVIMNLKAMPAVSWPGKSGRAYLLSIGERINWQKIVGRRRNAVAKSDETDMRKRWGKNKTRRKHCALCCEAAAAAAAPNSQREGPRRTRSAHWAPLAARAVNSYW
jgi:hypothetical protein